MGVSVCRADFSKDVEAGGLTGSGRKATLFFSVFEGHAAHMWNVFNDSGRFQVGIEL